MKRKITNVRLPIGVGVDMEDIARFSLIRPTRHHRFVERIFTTRERVYCFSRKDPGPFLAARFAAKEAVMKACATLCIRPPQWKEIDVRRRPNGAPFICLPKRFASYTVLVSLSHTRTHAIAFSIIYA